MALEQPDEHRQQERTEHVEPEARRLDLEEEAGAAADEQGRRDQQHGRAGEKQPHSVENQSPKSTQPLEPVKPAIIRPQAPIP